MTKPNDKFTLTVNDIELIEQALNAKISRRGIALLEKDDPKLQAELEAYRDLLGRIHQQKNWFRPKSKTYVGG